MKTLTFLLFLCVFAVAIENPQITENHFTMKPSKSISFSYDLPDGTYINETVQFIKSNNTEDGIILVHGYYEYTPHDRPGYKIRIDYIVDENGYRITGERGWASQISGISPTSSNNEANIPDAPKNSPIIKGLND